MTRAGATSLPEVRLIESGDIAIRLDVGYVVISGDGDVTVLDFSEMADEAPRLLPAVQETPIRVQVRAELVRAIDHFRWCWDCGARDADCRALGPGRKCCPDCRHRDTGHSVLGRVLAAPVGGRCTATCTPGWLLGKGVLSCTEEAGHAPPHVDPDGARWTEVPDEAPVAFVDEDAEALMMIASMVGVSTNAEPREVIAGVQARLGGGGRG